EPANLHLLHLLYLGVDVTALVVEHGPPAKGGPLGTAPSRRVPSGGGGSAPLPSSLAGGGAPRAAAGAAGGLVPAEYWESYGERRGPGPPMGLGLPDGGQSRT
ncbi:unnamed protein product, partial [Prorocentrum cordatum]